MSIYLTVIVNHAEKTVPQAVFERKIATSVQMKNVVSAQVSFLSLVNNVSLMQAKMQSMIVIVLPPMYIISTRICVKPVTLVARRVFKSLVP